MLCIGEHTKGHSLKASGHKRKYEVFVEKEVNLEGSATNGRNREDQQQGGEGKQR